MNDSLDNKPYSLLVFSDDWGRHPSSCQHIVKRIISNHQVCWVNTIGMRRPKLNVATLARAAEKFGQWTRRSKASPVETPDNLQVVNPMMWPSFANPLERWINRRLLAQRIARAIEQLPRPIVAVTTIPVVADLVGKLTVDRWIYYCVDDFSVWPGLDQATMAAMELELVNKVDAIIPVSEELHEKFDGVSQQRQIITHGVDVDFWHSTDAMSPNPMSRFEQPNIVFWGVLDRRMDTSFVKQLNNDLNQGTITIIGPQQNPDSELVDLPRVRCLPAVPFNSLPSIAAKG